MLSKNLTNGKSGLSNKHDTCGTLSVEGLSTVKGHLNTAYMANRSLQGQRNNQVHSLSYLSSTWGDSPCFMFRSGLMHGEIHPLNIAGERESKETVMTNHTNKKNS